MEIYISLLVGILIGYSIRKSFMRYHIMDLELENDSLRETSTMGVDKRTIINLERELDEMQGNLKLLEKANEMMYDLGYESAGSEAMTGIFTVSAGENVGVVFTDDNGKVIRVKDVRLNHLLNKDIKGIANKKLINQLNLCRGKNKNE